MRKQFLAFLCLAISATALSGVSRAASFTGVGFLPAIQDSRANGASADGSVVVGSSGNQAFRWTAAGGMVDLGFLPGTLLDFTQAFGVSADGSVVVGWSRGRAFRWTAAGGMVDVGVWPGYLASLAYGVSADGSVVVGWTPLVSAQSFGGQAFRWTAGGGMVGLGFLSPPVSSPPISVAESVSADGSVVVGQDGAGTLSAGSDSKAFRWTAVEGMVGFGGSGGSAEGVSADGSVVVGGASGREGSLIYGKEAFRWTAAGGMVGLGVLLGGSVSDAHGVSADGSVVVGSSDSTGGPKAVIWEPIHGLRNLKDVLVKAYGLNLTGWDLCSGSNNFNVALNPCATAVSADGSTIVGMGIDPSGNQEGWIAVIPGVAPAACGDGVIEGSEQCDDWNTLKGDGCSSACQVEPGWTCNGNSPTNCTKSLIDESNWILDTSTNLQWLKFNQTEGLSYNQVISTNFVSQGWAYATADQICTLTTDPQACTANPGKPYEPKGGAAALLTSGSAALQGITGLSNPDDPPGSHRVGVFVTQVNVYGTTLNPSISTVPDDVSQPEVASFLVRRVFACGTGPELALVAPLLMWLRSRRRRVSGSAAKTATRGRERFLRSLQRSFIKALVVAGLLVTWIAPSAKAHGIYWAGPIIGRANLDGTGVTPSFISGIGTPCVAVDAFHIYWGDGSIGRANLDGTGVTPSFISGTGTVLSVAVDGTYIYWRNYDTGSIGRANLDGTGVNESFITLSPAPAFAPVAVDRTHIYWTQSCLDERICDGGFIGRANLDGTEVNTTFIGPLSSGNMTGLAVDGSHIYWTNYNTGSIDRANLDGTGVQSFIAGANAFGVAADGTYIYWTGPSGIGRANLDGSDVNQSFITGVTALGVAVSHVFGCGTGPELALVAPLLMWLRSRRRRRAA
jgi:cysteine-rich repeat protein/probable HAF family extracellular repeat protein